MKNTLAFLIFNLMVIVLSAQTIVESKINQVKVFKRNAEIKRTATFNANTGFQEVVLSGISTSIIPSSLQIQLAESNVILVAAKYKKDYLNATIKNPKNESLYLQLEDINDQLAILSDQKLVFEGMLEILNKNQDLGGANASFTAQQVLELSKVYQTEYLKIRKSLRDLSKEEKLLSQKIFNVKNQIKEASARQNKPTGNIVLQIDSKSANTVNVSCKYIVNNAGWTPLYDLRSEGINENVKLEYKANIFQNTNVDWMDVPLTVSTGNPTQNNNRPVLNLLYANFYQKRVATPTRSISQVSNVATMDIKKKEVKEEASIATSVIENQLNIEFEISNKQTVLSDGKKNLVALNIYDINTEYIYHSVPKLDKGAFLLAKISNWSQYNLISGQANIFFEGAFVGKTNINPEVTTAELLISLGRDNGIVIERKAMKDFTSTKTLGTNTKEDIGYEIIVKNKKSVPIKIEILDQIPLPKNKAIEIVLQEKGNAKYSTEIGKLLWTMDIPARGSDTASFQYSVKYPKKQAVVGIK